MVTPVQMPMFVATADWIIADDIVAQVVTDEMVQYIGTKSVFTVNLLQSKNEKIVFAYKEDVPEENAMRLNIVEGNHFTIGIFADISAAKSFASEANSYRMFAAACQKVKEKGGEFSNGI